MWSIFCFVLANFDKRQRIQDLPNTFCYIFDIFSLLAHAQIKTGNQSKARIRVLRKFILAQAKQLLVTGRNLIFFEENWLKSCFLQSMHKEVNSDKRIRKATELLADNEKRLKDQG